MTCTTRHEEAMALADEANARIKAGDRYWGRAIFWAAAAMETKAAELAGDSEPSRSILYRSAAWLALSAGDSAEAVRLARVGLEGTGPRAELLAVLGDAQRALAVAR